MLHLALGFGEGEVVEVMVVGVGRVMELDEGLSGEQGVMVVDRENGGFVMEQVDLCSLHASLGSRIGKRTKGRRGH